MESQVNTIIHLDCPNCGASVETDNHQLSNLCSFCDTPVVKNTEIAPHYFEELLPFTFTERQASQSIHRYIQDKWFVPKKIKNKAN